MTVIDRDNTTGCYSIKFILWMIFYCYSTVAAFIFQKILLPLFPGYHGGNGLIGGGDSVFFHEIAVKLAHAIRMNGWSQWTLRPAEGATGNVSLLAALYAIFGSDPTVIIPVNAAVHATSGLLIFLIGRLLWPGKVGIYSGVVTASLFVVFPSALNWYAQIHKDGFAILGMLIIFYSWLQGSQSSSKVRLVLWIVLGTLAGAILVVFVRPYNIKLLMMSGIVVCLSTLLYYIVKKNTKKALGLVSLFFVFIVVFGIINSLMPRLFIVENREMVMDAFRQEGIDWNWERTRTIPECVDRLIENTALVRMMGVYHGKLVKAGSVVDGDFRPRNAWSSLAYLPRAALVALFAPFPNRWFDSASAVRLVSVVETMIWYLLVPGVLLTLWYRRSLQLVLMAVNALVFLIVLGFTTPVVGTLYRFRYLYLFVFLLLGVMGWMQLIRNNLGEGIKSIKHKTNADDPQTEQGKSPYQTGSFNTRGTVVAAGFTVITFTLASNVLLVVRDVVLARWFGLGNELDAFFIAMIIPMFLVTVLSIPIGTVVIPPLISAFEKGSKEEAQRVITLCSTMIFCAMFFLTLILYIFSSWYLPIIGWGFSAEKIFLSRRILMIVLPILFFSGFVILGNSILNARQKFALPALAQAIVPLIAILALIIAAKQIGIYAMAIGMFIGQMANLFVVSHYVRKEGYVIFPRISPRSIRDLFDESSQKLKSLLSQYAPLMLAALFVSLALPVNNMIAASLAPGSVSAFNLGMKFIIFFTGLVGTGISTVMLPHFSQYFARNCVADMKRELSFFLILSTVVPIPLTMAVFLLSSPLIGLIFQGGIFTVGDMATVTKIMEYGIIQMPFFCANMILVKYANARRKNTLIMIASLSGLIVNIVLNFVFIGKMGIAGVALATSLSMVFATGLFIIVGHRYGDIGRFDVAFMVLSWMLYLTVFLHNYYGNTLGIITTTAFLFITVTYRLVGLFGYRPFQKRRALQC